MSERCTWSEFKTGQPSLVSISGPTKGVLKYKRKLAPNHLNYCGVALGQGAAVLVQVCNNLLSYGSIGGTTCETLLISVGKVLPMLSDWTYPILAVVFITWGLGFVGLAAWSIHTEYKARQNEAQETGAALTGGSAIEPSDTQNEETPTEGNSPAC